MLTIVATAGSGLFAAGPAAAASPTIILNSSSDAIAVFAGYGDADQDNSITLTPRTPGIAITDSDAGVRAGDDTLHGEGLGDTIEGRAGNDTIDYSAWDRKVHVSLDGERGVADGEVWIPAVQHRR